MPSESSGAKGGHDTITKAVWRSKLKVPVELVSVTEHLDRSVKSFSLRVSEPTTVSLRPSASDTSFSFLPGQWIDLHVPSTSDVGGFSITSAPHRLLEERTFSLAVKWTDRNPVVRWLHESARPGVEGLEVRVGGEFWLDVRDLEAAQTKSGAGLAEKTESDVVFIAGGMGITPLMSMVETLSNFNLNRAEGVPPVRATLLYTSKATSPLFEDRLSELARDELSGLSVRLFATGGEAGRRMQVEDLEPYFAQRAAAGPKVYLCGPPAFERFVLDSLTKLGVPESYIKFEKWW